VVDAGEFADRLAPGRKAPLEFGLAPVTIEVRHEGGQYRVQVSAGELTRLLSRARPADDAPAEHTEPKEAGRVAGHHRPPRLPVRPAKEPSVSPAPSLTANARRVLDARYLRRDSERRICETPEELFRRVARAVANAELLFGSARLAALWEGEFEGLLASLDFLPNSPTLMNAGTLLGQLSACFVLPVGDSMESIFEALKQMALVQRTGGGTGFSFSRLRPAGDLVASTGGEASGPVSFMRIFDCGTEHIRQGGRRRGANMGILAVDHPDVLDFVRAKARGADLRNFNLSVGVTDEFMRAVDEGHPFTLTHPRTGRPVSTVSAREIFDAIVAAAWESGDPGLLFLDAINRANPTPALGRIEATNPCGEIPLLPYEACTLGSINLAHMVSSAGPHPALNWDRLRETTRKAVRFLDDAVEVNRYPLAEIDQASRGTRKLGLGVMGFAETLIRLGISYASVEAVAMAEHIMARIAEAARDASEALAQERGVFPCWSQSTLASRGERLRNATLTAIAPTGTIGILAGTTAGIEPLFALAYRRSHVLGEQVLEEISPLLGSHLRQRGLDERRVVAEVIARGTLEGVPGVPGDIRNLFVTALQIPWEHHLQIQAAFQRHVDNAVSKTVNLPQDSSAETVANVYRRAWELGLKGITIYRYGSRTTQVLELGAGAESYHYDHAVKCDPMECRL
jgi:ribonucleoside-diphosphate reductase alpha chain